MKILILRFVLFFTVLGGMNSSLTAFVVEETPLESTEQQVPIKRYIAQDNIRFQDNQIYIYENQNWMQINALLYDANGLYYIASMRPWVCSWCKFENKVELYRCEGCRRARYEQ